MESRVVHFPQKDDLSDFIVDDEKEVDEEEQGKEVMNKFMESLQTSEEELTPYLQANEPMKLRQGRRKQRYEAQECTEDYKVRDHYHATGEYRGAAHNRCNLQKKRQVIIAVFFFYILRWYDAHHIMRGIHRNAENKRIKVIPNNMESTSPFSREHYDFSTPCSLWRLV